MSTASDRSSKNRVTLLNLIFSSFLGFGVYLAIALSLGVTSEGKGANQPDFLFNADVTSYVDRVENENLKEVNTKHLLRVYTSIPAVRILKEAFNGSSEERTIWAALVFNVTCLTLTFALLSWFALRETGSLVKVWIFNVIQLFSTSNVVMSAPDHFSQSNLLMVGALLLFLYAHKSALNFVLLCVIGVVIVGTTTSNVAFACLVLYFFLYSQFNFNKWLHRTVTNAFWLAPLIGGGLFYLAVQHYEELSELLFVKFFNFRVFEELGLFLYYSLASLVYPVVAPSPALSGAGNITLEPWGLGSLAGIYLVPFAILLVGMFWQAFQMLRSEQESLLGQLLILWLVFNVIFHNIWGDEYILFSGHYSFVLLFLLVYLLKELSVRRALLLSIPVLMGQASFVYSTIQLTS